MHEKMRGMDQCRKYRCRNKPPFSNGVFPHKIMNDLNIHHEVRPIDGYFSKQVKKEVCMYIEVIPPKASFLLTSILNLFMSYARLLDNIIIFLPTHPPLTNRYSYLYSNLSSSTSSLSSHPPFILFFIFYFF